MKCCISFGQKDKKLYILLFATLFRILTTLIYGRNSLEYYEEQSFFIYDSVLKNQIQLQSIMRFLGITILSAFCYIYINYISLNNLNDSKKKKHKFRLIYNGLQIDSNKNILKILFTAFLLVLVEIAAQIYNLFGPCNSDYWPIEMLFNVYFIKKIFKIKLYKHQKYSVGFITIVCSLLKLLSSITANGKIELQLFYLPLIFVIILFIKSYTYTKIKWLMDIKYISISKMLLIYGLFGFFTSLIIYIVTIKYFPSFDEYFGNDDLPTDPLNHEEFIYETFGVIAYMCFSFLSKFFNMFILKILTPIHVLANNSLYYLFIQIPNFILIILGKYNINEYENEYENENDYYLTITYFLLINIFSICGYVIYLELIELKFCGCDYNLKKNIIYRSKSDSSFSVESNEEIDDSFIIAQTEPDPNNSSLISNSSISSTDK